MAMPTARQREILELRCVRGLSVADAASALSISPLTVRNQVTAMIRRTGCRSFAQTCYRHGLAATGPRVPIMRPQDV